MPFTLYLSFHPIILPTVNYFHSSFYSTRMYSGYYMALMNLNNSNVIFKLGACQLDSDKGKSIHHFTPNLPIFATFIIFDNLYRFCNCWQFLLGATYFKLFVYDKVDDPELAKQCPSNIACLFYSKVHYGDFRCSKFDSLSYGFAPLSSYNGSFYTTRPSRYLRDIEVQLINLIGAAYTSR